MRYEQQAKEKEQAALAKTVIENVLKTIQDERTQKDILASAVAEVEREIHFALFISWTFAHRLAVPIVQSWSSPRPSRIGTLVSSAVARSNINRYFFIRCYRCNSHPGAQCRIDASP